jgi:FdhD protein
MADRERSVDSAGLTAEVPCLAHAIPGISAASTESIDQGEAAVQDNSHRGCGTPREQALMEGATIAPLIEGNATPGDRVEVSIVRWTRSGSNTERDVVSVEEPLEIFVDGRPFHLTMRSPGEELALAAGICFGEGLIESIDDLDGINYCKDVSSNRINVYRSAAKRTQVPQGVKQKRSTTYSSCGICGKELVDDIAGATEKIPMKTIFPISGLIELQDALGAGQFAYRLTGGAHAAAVFDASGNLLAHAEDVGRHNALDKAIGRILFARKREEAVIVLLTSRLSYEMVQKTARLGIEILAGASAPTSLGVQLAQAVSLTLVGFLRAHRGNVYSCPERIIP